MSSLKTAKWTALIWIVQCGSKTMPCAADSLKTFAFAISKWAKSPAGLSVDFFSEEGGAGKFTPLVRNVEIRNMRTKKTKYALYLRGLKKAHTKDVQLLDGDFEGIAQPDVVENVNRLALRNARENGKLMPPVESRKCVSY
jgi:hypothetical protein